MTLSKKEGALYIIGLFVISCALVLGKIDMPPGTNIQSRLGTIESLVSRQTFSTEHSMFRSVDSIRVRGELYSSKPPVLPTLLAGGYALYAKITGITFQTNMAHSIILINVLSGFLPHVLILIYFYLLLKRIVDTPLAQVLGYTAISVGYIGILYASELSNHIPAAAISLMALYYAYRIRTDISTRIPHWIAVGFLCGLLPTIDIPSASLSAALFIYLFTFSPKKTLLLFVPAALPPLALHFSLMLHITESVLPTQIRQPDGVLDKLYWNNPGPLDAPSDPRWLYAFHMFFGHHGLLIISPVLFFGLHGLFRAAKKSKEATLILSVFVIQSLYYIFLTRSYGGVNVGLRWLIPILPLVLLFASTWADHSPSKSKIILYTLTILTGFFFVFVHPTGWMYSIWSFLFYL